MKPLLKIITVLTLFSVNLSAYAEDQDFPSDPPAPINDYIGWLAILGIVATFIYFYKSKKAIKN